MPSQVPDALEVLEQETASSTLDNVKVEAERDTALVVSGGVSLGSYQAGFLYYFVEYMKLKRLEERKLWPEFSPSPFAVATGASAGSINASLAAIESCRDPQPDPTQSIFYRTWIPVSIDGLYPTDGSSVTQLSLFSRKPIDEAARQLGDYLADPKGWIAKDCAVDIGMVATRLEGRVVKLRLDRPSLETSRMTEKFAFSFDKRANRAAAFRQLINAQQLTKPAVKAMAEFFLRPGHEPELVTFPTFARMLKASSSFPLAFEPVQVPYHIAGNPERNTEDFIDGGVFENVPVRLAARILDLKELATRDQITRPRDMNYVVVDSDVLSWKRSVRNEVSADGLLAVLQSFAGDFIGSARTTELLSAIEENPDLRNSSGGLLMAERRGMLASDHLYAFSGFFDERFRMLDFYLGMLDARSFVQQPYWLESDKALSGGSVVRQVDNELKSPIFKCFLQLEQASSGMDTPVGLERATKLCGLPSRQPSATDADLAELIVLFDASIEVKNYAMSRLSEGKEAEFDKWLGHLQANGFKLRMLGDTVEPKDFKLWLRRRVGDMLDQLADEQASSGFVISDGGSVALNSLLHYVEPTSILGVGFHLNRGLDLDYGWGIGNHQRLGVAARLRYFSMIRALQGDEMTATVFGAVNYSWVNRMRFLCSVCGFELGADLGFGHRWLSARADAEEFGARDRVARTEGWAAVAGLGATLTFLQRAYLKLDNHYVWPTEEFILRHPSITIGLGIGYRWQ